MNIQEFIPYIIQITSTVIAFAFIIGKYKSTFDHHNKILDRHEKAIDKILERLDAMNSKTETANNDISFVKGWIFGKGQEK